MKTSPRKPRFFLALTLLALSAASCLKPPQIEEPNATVVPLRSRILAADGSLLATLFIENRDPVSLGDVPAAMKDAVVAAEDQRFFTHKGFDVKSILRAGIANVASRRTVQGGSTITQQYVKNIYYPTDRKKTFQQKTKEAMLAWKLEQEFSKDEILERYLNTVYFGEGAYGLKAASEQFFRKRVQDLTVADSALLAGLIKAPESFNPRRAPDRAQARRDYVLQRMQALGMITPQEAAEFEATPLGLSDPPVRAIREPHWVDYVKRFAMGDADFGRDETERAGLLYRGGIDIHTSLDLNLQEMARQAIAGVLNRPGDPAAALVAIDPRTGKVVAMAGGRDYSVSQVNLALGKDGGGSGRQPGSSFKPFVLATAIEDGIRTNALYSSVPPTIRIRGAKPYRPQNSEGGSRGMMTLSEAMVSSVNAVYVRLGMDIGNGRVAGMAKRMGIQSKLRPVPSLPLGTNEVSALEMGSAYSTLANYGVNVGPSPVVKVDLQGPHTINPKPKLTRALDPGVAWLVTDVLRQVVERGTGTRAQIGRPAAGKTGTTDDFYDAWFVGYTPELVTAVWVGYPQGSVSMRNVRGVKVFGGTFPAMIWSSFMSRALEGKPVLQFEIPKSDLISIEIDPVTGLLAGPFCSGRQTVEVLRQLAPSTTCPSPPPIPSPPPTVTDTAQPSPSPTESPAPSQGPAPEPSPSG